MLTRSVPLLMIAFLLHAGDVAAVCGNFVPEPGEDCDSGPSQEDCCTDSCTFVGAGAVCDDNNVCTWSTCDGAGTCAPADDCHQASVSVLREKNNIGFLNNALKWRWKSSDAVDVSEFGLPTATTGYALCLQDAGATSFAFVVEPAGDGCGAHCWKPTATGWTFAVGDYRFPPYGIHKITLRAGGSGKAKVAMLVRDYTLLPAPPYADPVSVRLVRSDAPVCFEATFPTAIKNTDGAYLAKVRNP